MSTAIDKLQEARRIYGAAVDASQALVEEAAAVKKDFASLRAKLSRLHDDLDELAAVIADHRRVLRGAWGKLIVLAVVGGFLGSLLGNAAAEAWPWPLSR